MISNPLTTVSNFLHAQLCYQLFISPMHFLLEKEYRDFAQRACNYLEKERTETIHFNHPRHYVIHRFAQKNKNAKKILIAHGWMSRAAYMWRLISTLHKEGYDVYAIDFPAHGEAKGVQLTWIEAVSIIREVINQSGPFYALIGHSFGGSMLLNTLNLAGQYPEWNIDFQPEKVILLASPTRMRTPVKRIAKQLKLSAKGFLFLRQIFKNQVVFDLKQLHVRHYIAHAKIPFLCIHGKDDVSITPRESILFCNQYPHAHLSLLSDVDHVNILMDIRVENQVSDFLK